MFQCSKYQRRKTMEIIAKICSTTSKILTPNNNQELILHVCPTFLINIQVIYFQVLLSNKKGATSQSNKFLQYKIMDNKAKKCLPTLKVWVGSECLTRNLPTLNLPTSIFLIEQRRRPLSQGSLGARSACKPSLILSLSTVVIAGNVVRMMLASLKRRYDVFCDLFKIYFLANHESALFHFYC